MEPIGLVAVAALVIWWLFSAGKQRDASAKRIVHARMPGMLRPHRPGFEVNFETMTIAHGDCEYLLARVSEYNAQWFVKLTSVERDGIKRSAAAFVKAWSSGRLTQERLEDLEASYANWRSENPDADDRDWDGGFELRHLRDQAEERKERETRTPTRIEELEEKLQATMRLEWARMPPKEEGWIDASYEHCARYFRENPGLEPDKGADAFVVSQSRSVWTPPKHLSDGKIRASFDRVIATKRELAEAYRDEGKGDDADWLDRYIQPWPDPDP